MQRSGSCKDKDEIVFFNQAISERASDCTVAMPVKELRVPFSIRLASDHDLDPAADTLAAAFEDYAWTKYVIPEQNYRERLHALQRLYLTHALTHGVVVVTADISGVAALLPATASEPGPTMIEEVVALHGDRIGRLDSGLPQTSNADAWALETLGVTPVSQGLGIGSALIKAAVREVQTHGGKLIRLETSDERNVQLYLRHGFEVTGQVTGTNGPPSWAMQLELS